MLRVPTGVKGLDEMLGGGLPKQRVILLCGGPGAGKTIFCLQFLAAAVERGERGVYVTLEEPMSFILENVDAFGWNLKEKESSGRLKLLNFYTVPYVGGSELRSRQTSGPTLSFVREVVGAVESIDAEHVVIDPLTSIAIHEQREPIKRYKMSELFTEFRKIGCTSIATSEITSSDGGFHMEEFLADGVIRLDKTIQNFSFLKTLRIEKMRGVKFDEQPRRYMIDERGFTVFHTERVRV
ncbi:MAG: AAA family ATPase [Candidatus Bathyarchaeota archaeon]|nr:AAA family ATPase [Candidatus Bathyarchaeota archaeon]MDH5686482.1 AAA family ATPase [Candidatus Bathyarchaeota archaeon]